MRRTLNFLRTCAMVTAAAASVTMISCKDDAPAQEPVIPVLAAVPTSFVAGGVTTFTVTADGKDVTSAATITETGSSTAVSAATWTSTTAGDYTFQATYDGQKSNTVTVTVTAAPVPVVTLSADPTTFFEGESTTFTVTVDGADKTSEATITEAGGAAVTGATWTGATAGEYTFKATHGGMESNTVVITVEAAPIPYPEGYDSTDNQSAPFVLAANSIDLDGDGMDDMVNLQSAVCPDGWRLPTYNEGMFILVYLRAYQDFNFQGAQHLTSTLLRDVPDEWSANSTGYDIQYGHPAHGYAATTGTNYARCIKETPAKKVYPYVVEDAAGPIIVSRDAEGGIVEKTTQQYYEGAEVSAFHDNWTSTSQHGVSAGDNSISRKLQVANADVQEAMFGLMDAKECPEGWRLPTYKELILIYAMGGGPAASYDTDKASQYYNAPVTATPLNAVAGFTAFNADYYYSGTWTEGRGASAIAFPFYETPRYGPGKIADSTVSYYLRCVRDVE